MKSTERVSQSKPSKYTCWFRNYTKLLNSPIWFIIYYHFLGDWQLCAELFPVEPLDISPVNYHRCYHLRYADDSVTPALLPANELCSGLSLPKNRLAHWWMTSHLPINISFGVVRLTHPSPRSSAITDNQAVVSWCNSRKHIEFRSVHHRKWDFKDCQLSGLKGLHVATHLLFIFYQSIIRLNLLYYCRCRLTTTGQNEQAWYTLLPKRLVSRRAFS